MKIIKNISFISLLIFLFLLPFGFTWANVFWFLNIALTFISKDLYKNFDYKRLGLEEKYFMLLSFAYVFWCLVSLLLSVDLNRGWQLVGRYIPILLLPLSFVLSKVTGILANLKLSTFVFVIGVFVSSFVCLILSYKNCWQETGNGVVFDTTILSFGWSTRNAFESILYSYNNFSYKYLSHFIHPSYYALYFIFSLIFIFDNVDRSRKIKYKVLVCVVALYSFVFLFLLQSRSGYFALMSVFLCAIFYFSLMQGKIRILIFGFLVSIFVFILFIKVSGRFNSTISSVIDIFKTEKQMESNVNDRIIIWHNALQVIKEHPILGVGIGDTDTELEKQYKKNNLDFEYGTHNQYIYAQLSMGIVGLILLLAMLLVPLYFGIKNRYFPLIGFSVAVMINLLFENMLTRNAGLMFIPWATMLLLMMSEEKKKEISNE